MPDFFYVPIGKKRHAICRAQNFAAVRIKNGSHTEVAKIVNDGQSAYFIERRKKIVKDHEVRAMSECLSKLKSLSFTHAEIRSLRQDGCKKTHGSIKK